ncbi:MAG: cell envelope integrity EipB family protein [Rhodospirillales bacterium]
MRTAFRPLGFALALCLPAVALPQTASAELAPHRAVYDISLDRVNGSRGIATANGRMVLNWRDVCDGWATDMDLRVTLFDPEGEEMRFGMIVSSWESKDGRRYRFLVKERATFMAPTDYKGEATLDSALAGQARFSEPESQTLSLPQGTLFPTAHSLAVLAAAEAGEVFLSAPLFDGSENDPEALVTASATILGPMTDAGEGLPRLAETPYYGVTLAFFEAGDEQPLPTHEVTLRLYANGVADRQLFDYGDFVLAADIGELSYHPDPGC